jgi:hypothetical protein
MADSGISSVEIPGSATIVLVNWTVGYKMITDYEVPRYPIWAISSLWGQNIFHSTSKVFVIYVLPSA